MRIFLLGWILLGVGCMKNLGDDASGLSDSTRLLDGAVGGDQALNPCRFRALGYGQEVPESMRTNDTSGDRKSGTMCLVSERPNLIWVKPKAAGNCDGDSGGPLFIDGTLKLVGVHSGSTPGCDLDEEASLFASVSDQRAFIEQALASEPQ